jgi:hypothetical protein
MASPANATLSHGNAIEYRAYTRRFFPDSKTVVLFLAATCYYDSAGFSISFQPTASGFQLVEFPPTGIVPQLVTYYSASWNSSQQETTPPTHVEITDAFGQRRIAVQSW